jgi:hypothetical protein
VAGMDVGYNGGALYAFYGARGGKGRGVDRRSFKTTFLGGGGAPVCGRLMGGGGSRYWRGMGDADALRSLGSWEGEPAA